jgi:RNA-binding protein 5/10
MPIDKRTQKSKGFAFVRFASVQDAVDFMELCEGEIYVKGKSFNADLKGKCFVEFCREAAKDDWNCSNCDGYNYSRRLTCYRCDAPKPESFDVKVNTGLKDASEAPHYIILLRNLDALTSAEKVLLRFCLRKGLL